MSGKEGDVFSTRPYIADCPSWIILDFGFGRRVEQWEMVDCTYPHNLKLLVVCTRRLNAAQTVVKQQR
jgi:hypothetical protein